MHTRAFRPSGPGVRGQRRKLDWATFDTTIPVPAGPPTNSTVDLLNQFELAGASKLGVTIMRTHLQLQLPYAVAGRWEVGLSVVRVTDIGTTRVNPNADNDLDWALFNCFYESYSGATIDARRDVTIDLRAKRKCQEMGQTWGLSLWNSTAAAQTVSAFCRTLVALP